VPADGNVWDPPAFMQYARRVLISLIFSTYCRSTGGGRGRNSSSRRAATCQKYGITFRLNDAGHLIIGSDLSGNEPALWPTLIDAIEVHLEPVVALVAAGWYLRAGFSDRQQ
jgi:hypothetical protein